MTAFLKAQWLHLVLALGAVGFGVFQSLNAPGSGIHWQWLPIAVGLMTPLTPWFIKDASSIVGPRVTSIIGTAATVVLGMLAAYKAQTNATWIPVAAAWVAQLKFVFGGGAPTVPPRAAIALLAFLCVGVAACAHVDAIARDVESCVTADGPQVLKDLEHGSVKAIEGVLVCEAEAPDPEADIPMCVETGLVSIVAGMGPDGERFKECVVAKVENDPDATPMAKARARAVHGQIIKARRGR